jgi:hypothetical protein
VATERGGVATERGGVATERGGVATERGGVATERGGVATERGGVATSLVLATFLWAFYDLSDGRSCIKIFLKKTLYEFLRNLKYLIIMVRVSPTFVVSLVTRNLMGKHNKLMVAMSTI